MCIVVCGCRFSSKPEKRSLAPMNKRLWPSWETAAPSTWGKVGVLVSELQRRQSHSQSESGTCVDFFQFLMHTWRWLGMRWRRALREKHLEVWRTFFWPWVRTAACVLMGSAWMVLYSNFSSVYSSFFFILKWSVPGAFQLTLRRPCTRQWR